MQDQELRKIILKKETPFYVFDLKVLRHNYQALQKLFPRFKFFYSVKTNPLQEILGTLNKESSNFDAATIGEIKLVISAGISPSRILFTHPIKLPTDINTALQCKVENYTFDTLDELQLLIKYAPDTRYFLRICPPVEGTFYEYNDKFGASISEIYKILNFATENSISIYGLSFHVGSQNMSLAPWIEAIKLCNLIINKYYKTIPTLRILNIGSGFPVKYNFDKCITIKEIVQIVRDSIKNLPKDMEFWAEPGRILVADTGILVSTILRNIKRDKNRWLFVDIGIYHGLIEILESRGRLTYPIGSLKKGFLIKYNISGNTLDPDDTLATNIMLPENLIMGDRIIIHDIGAYTTSFFTDYHALPKPKIYIVDK